MRRATALAVLMAAVAGAGWFAGTASAAFTNVESVNRTSIETSSDKEIAVSCPAGKKVTGAGADVTPGNGDVLIEAIVPDATLTSVTVRAVEDEDGTGASWFVAAYAICATPPAGLERVAVTSASSSAAKEVTAPCPSGKRVLGVGGATTGASGQLLLDGVRPKLDLTGAVVNALEDETGTALGWTVSAYAICATAPVMGLQRTSGTTPASSSTPSQLGLAVCPAGKVLVGMGGEINGAGGQVVLDAVYPHAGQDASGAGAWEDDTGNPNAWSVTTYAMCADQARRAATTTDPSNFGKGADAVCPSGTDIAGTGAAIDGAFGRAWPTTLRPDSDDVLRFQAEAESAYAWTATSVAVCMTTTALRNREVVFAGSSGGVPLTATAPCPSGKRVVGIGGDSLTLNGDEHIGLDALVPNAALTSASVTNSNFLGSDSIARVDAYAVCATAPPGLQLVSKTSPADSQEYKSVTVSCPAGKHVVGAGASVPSTSHVILDDMMPDAALTKVTASGAEDATRPESDWVVRAYAICARR